MDGRGRIYVSCCCELAQTVVRKRRRQWSVPLRIYRYFSTAAAKSKVQESKEQEQPVLGRRPVSNRRVVAWYRRSVIHPVIHPVIQEHHNMCMHTRPSIILFRTHM